MPPYVLYQRNRSRPQPTAVATPVPVATSIVIASQPSSTVEDTNFTVTVQVKDQFGANFSSTASISVAKQSGTGTLSGTSPVSAVAGLATFSNLQMDTGSATVVLRFTSSGLGTVDTTSITVTASGGDPVPSGNILIDTRAGGAQSWQAGGMTTIANLDSVWDEDIGHTLESFNTDVDGSGTNGRRSTWPASPGSEKDSQLNKYFTGSAPAIITGSNTNGWQIQFKRKLASDWAYNTNGQGGKVSLSLRSKDNGGDLNRIYMVENNAGYNFQIDNNGYFSGDFARSIALSRGVLETLTVFINPTGGIIQVTRNGVLEMNLSGQGIGSAGFSQVQFHVAYFIQNGCISDEWDYVINVP